jgi:hypothetical protein
LFVENTEVGVRRKTPLLPPGGSLNSKSIAKSVKCCFVPNQPSPLRSPEQDNTQSAIIQTGSVTFLTSQPGMVAPMIWSSHSKAKALGVPRLPIDMSL